VRRIRRAVTISAISLGRILGEAGEGGGFRVEGGDGFDQAGDGEGIANAAVAADKVQGSGFAGEAYGNAHEGGDAGAVDLRNVIEGDDDFAGATLNGGLQSVMQLLGGLANGQAAVNVEEENAAGFADVDFHGDAVGHRQNVARVRLNARRRTGNGLGALYDGGGVRQGIKHRGGPRGRGEKRPKACWYAREVAEQTEDLKNESRG